MSEPQTPDWVRDAVFYQIFPDRFAKSDQVPKPAGLKPWGSTPTVHGYQGGDLMGVVDRLDYLADLGINALYFTPVFQSASNHRYHTHDYEKVDPMLGGNKALRRLLDEAHDRGIKVVLDGVFNHASRGFFPFHDLLENGADSAYTDWFYVQDFPLTAYHPDEPPNYGSWWGLPALPKFKVETPAVRDFLWHIGRFWVDFGIDGWRLDVPQEINDDDFWREFRRRVKEGNPEAYIVGEIWGDGSRWLQGDMFDAVMNYMLTKACLGFFVGKALVRDELEPDPLRDVRPMNAQRFAQAIAALQETYHSNINAVLLNLLDSHDMARFVTLAGDDRSALRLAWLFLMTYPGAPCLFYGDEIGLDGGHEPACRKAFPWDESAWDTDLRADLRRYIHLRHEHPALRRGHMRTVSADDHLYAFVRETDAESVLVALNAGHDPASINVRESTDWAANAESIRDLLTGETWNAQDGRIEPISVPSRSGRVLLRTARS